MSMNVVAAPPRNVPVVMVPRKRGEWCKWAEVQIEDGAGWGRETELLRVLAGRADARGTAEIGVPLLMRKLKRSESTVREYLQKLRDRGVLRTRQRGRGPARHQLVAQLIERQLCLFDDVGRGQAPAAAADPPVQVSATAAPHVAVADPGRAPSTANPPADHAQPSSQPDPAVTAAEQTAVCVGARERAPLPSPVSPSLEKVLTILSEASGLRVEDGEVDIALRTFPDADHARAARFVVLQGLQPDARCRAASMLLFRALERQDRDRYRNLTTAAPRGGGGTPSAPSCPPGGRRRSGSFRWEGGKYDRASGLMEHLEKRGYITSAEAESSP